MLESMIMVLAETRHSSQLKSVLPISQLIHVIHPHVYFCAC